QRGNGRCCGGELNRLITQSSRCVDSNCLQLTRQKAPYGDRIRRASSSTRCSCLSATNNNLEAISVHGIRIQRESCIRSGISINRKVNFLNTVDGKRTASDFGCIHCDRIGGTTNRCSSK